MCGSRIPDIRPHELCQDCFERVSNGQPARRATLDVYGRMSGKTRLCQQCYDDATPDWRHRNPYVRKIR